MAEDDTQRLAKVVAAQVPCSRREAEQYITDGRVKVDGQTVLLPQHRVDAMQRVEIDTGARLVPPAPVTLLLHKPAGMRTQVALTLPRESNRWADDASRVPITRALAAGHRVLLALPEPASGLTVLSQDPSIVRRLTEEAAWVEQELIADVTGTIQPDGLARLGRGLVAQGQTLPPARVSWQNETRLRFALKGITPEQVPWLCEQVGLRLEALRRIRIGSVPMAGLPVGQWRCLGHGERF